MNRRREWFDRPARAVPGGAQAGRLSGAHLFPALGPLVVERARGCRLRDVDGREFFDPVMGFGANVLGHCRADVGRAACEALSRGNHPALPTRIEALVAERLVRGIPCAERVRLFSRP